MNADLLLDAIGMADDHFFLEDTPVRRTSLRRGLAAALVAALILVLSVVTALAVSTPFREFLFSVFQIESQESPPSGSANKLPTELTNSGLKELKVINIEENVTAHYFTTDGYLMAVDGGFYTCSYYDSHEGPPDDAAFWEITREGIRQVEHTRVNFPLPVSDRTLEIVFDYAVINSKLCIKMHIKVLNHDPYGYGWEVSPIGDRTDVVFLEVPYMVDNSLTRKFYLLELDTLEITNLAPNLPITSDLDYVYGQLSTDMRYLLISGFTSGYIRCYWLYDTENGTVEDLKDLTGASAWDAYFLNDETILIEERLGEYPNSDHFNIIRYHIPSGIRHTLLENIHMDYCRPVQHWGPGGARCYTKLTRPDGSIAIMDMRTKDVLELTGISGEGLDLAASPGGTHILLGYRQQRSDGEPGYSYTTLGLLDVKTQTVKMLTRNVGSNNEHHIGWLDDNTIVISSFAPDHNYQEKDNYYVYVYTFE